VTIRIQSVVKSILSDLHISVYVQFTHNECVNVSFTSTCAGVPPFHLYPVHILQFKINFLCGFILHTDLLGCLLQGIRWGPELVRRSLPVILSAVET